MGPGTRYRGSCGGGLVATQHGLVTRGAGYPGGIIFTVSGSIRVPGEVDICGCVGVGGVPGRVRNLEVG